MSYERKMEIEEMIIRHLKISKFYFSVHSIFNVWSHNVHLFFLNICVDIFQNSDKIKELSEYRPMYPPPGILQLALSYLFQYKAVHFFYPSI